MRICNKNRAGTLVIIQERGDPFSLLDIASDTLTSAGCEVTREPRDAPSFEVVVPEAQSQHAMAWCLDMIHTAAAAQDHTHLHVRLK